MTVRRVTKSITVSAGGAAEEYTPDVFGFLHSVHYDKSNFADGVDFTITDEDSGQTLWSEENVNADASRYPRAATHSVAGAASLYAAAGEAVNGRIPIAGSRIKIVIASGGNATAGAFHFLIDDRRR